LWALGRLEYNVEREDAAEPVTRRMLELLADRVPDDATRMLRAIGEVSLGQIRLKQGHGAEGVKLLESGRKALVDLRSSGYGDAKLPDEISSAEERLARARVSTGDLDGAVAMFLDLVRSGEACDDSGSPSRACRTLGVRLSWTGDVYAALDRPNLGEPAKAAPLYERALHIQERIAALDAHDRQARFDLAARCGKLGDAIWQSDPKRALELYDRALATARELASKAQFELLLDSYQIAICRPLIQLGRLAEARRVLTEELRRAKTDAQSAYADRVGEISVRLMLPQLLVAEGKRAEARQSLEQLATDTQALHAANAGELDPVFFLSASYRQLASLADDADERRQDYLKSAAAWHSWPATSFTAREEQNDLAAARR